MADVILFRPNISKMTDKALSPRPPWGLLFIAAPLIENNYSVKIIDEEINPYWADELDRELNDSTICVGVTSMTGWQILGGLQFSRAVKKKRPGIPVVWGGLHPSILPEQTIKNDFVDIVVRGEGEEPFLKIVTTLKGGGSIKEIPNVYSKENGRVYSNPKNYFMDINKLSLLPYTMLEWGKYRRREPSTLPNCKLIIDILADRGCPHKCGFCYNLNVNNCAWRGLSANKIIEQIEYLKEKFLIDGINFLGDNFFVDKKRVSDVCAEIIKRKIEITWHADCRIDYFSRYDDKFINLLKESGCKVLTFGVESGSPRMLKLMQKGISLDQIFKVNESLKKHQIGCSYHFMAGFPEETKEDLLQTYAVMMKISDRYPEANFLGPSIYTPYPGTPLYDKCVEMGFKGPEKLEDWANFGWDEKTSLTFMSPGYLRWMLKSVNVIKYANIAKRVSGMKWVGWWFRLRAKVIIKFNIIGPQPEVALVYFFNAVIIFMKKLFKFNTKK